MNITTRVIPLTLAAVGLAVGLGLTMATASRAKAFAEPRATLKGVVHVNFADAARQKQGLKNVRRILKAEPNADLEVVCHSGGLELLIKDKSEYPDEVAALVKEGARFVACENSLRDKSLSSDDLIPGVGTVPSGAVEVIRKQQEGYGYFRP